MVFKDTSSEKVPIKDRMTSLFQMGIPDFQRDIKLSHNADTKKNILLIEKMNYILLILDGAEVKTCYSTIYIIQ